MDINSYLPWINELNRMGADAYAQLHSSDADVFKLLLMNYDQCCQFLQNKYGIPEGDYFFSSQFRTINSKIKRTSEGLYIHHIDEDKTIMLSEKEHAANRPFAFQKAERLVYCDLLEHLVLHIKIVEYPASNQYPNELPGLGGVVNYIVPELNDIYSGIQYKQPYKIKTIETVYNRFDQYLVCIKKWKEVIAGNIRYESESIYKSYNTKYGIWSGSNNKELYEILKLIS